MNSISGAGHMVRGVTGPTMARVAGHVAETAQTVTDVLDTSQRAEMAQDLQKLKVGLNLRDLGSSQLQTAYMTAGALLAGPHGVVVADLATRLHETVSDRRKMDALAEQVQHFGDRQPGESPLSDAVYLGLNNQVTRALVDGGTSNVPVALFMGGAILDAEQRQGAV